ncbi:MAG: hypothetical protein ACOH1T_12200 [Microbacteriaceae bacterium]
MIARRAATVLLAGALAVGMSGCTFFAVQATQIEYAPSDGTQATLGTIKALNMLAISEDGVDVSILGTLSNSGTSDAKVTLQVEDAAGKKITEMFTVVAGSTVSLGTDDGIELVYRGVDATVGGLINMYVQPEGSEGIGIRVPVLPPNFEYEGLEPGPKPTPTLTPDPMATLPVEGND